MRATVFYLIKKPSKANGASPGMTRQHEKTKFHPTLHRRLTAPSGLVLSAK